MQRLLIAWLLLLRVIEWVGLLVQLSEFLYLLGVNQRSITTKHPIHMSNTFFQLVLLLAFGYSLPTLHAQYDYEPSEAHPYGLPHPEAPASLQDYQALIGRCDCQSTRRKPDGTWAEAVAMTWEFKYIMNGTAVQDQTLKADGAHSGSIRQFDAKQQRWYVHYYASAAPTPKLSVWEGGKQDDNIVLYKDQASPTGMEGKYRITFSNISEKGFNWIGEWTSLDESVVYPTWKITCTKQQ